MVPRARLVCPALRWRRGSFRSERAKIEQALAAGVGGFILFGGTRAAVTALTSALRDTAGRPLLLGSDFERGPGQQVRGLTELPPPAALGYLNDLDATYACGQITGTEARAVGLNWIFAPVCDLDIEPKNPIVQTRSFGADPSVVGSHAARSEEHTSELQSRRDLVCRLLLEKKKKTKCTITRVKKKKKKRNTKKT